jgi:hypothetical protein
MVKFSQSSCTNAFTLKRKLAVFSLIDVNTENLKIWIVSKYVLTFPKSNSHFDISNSPIRLKLEQMDEVTFLILHSTQDFRRA